MKTYTTHATGILNRWTQFLGMMLMVALMMHSAVASGPATVNLGTAGDFVILAKTGISTTGVTAITGDIGVSPAAATFITGFGLILDGATGTFSKSSLVTGNVYAADYTAPTPTKMTTAISDMETAYTDAAGRTLPDFTELHTGNLTGQTLVPGLYKWGTGVSISEGGVTISGSATDIWIFQIAQDLTVGNGAIVTLAGGAQASNIFWQVAGQVNIGTTAAMKGIILCQTQIAMNTGAALNGRALAQTAVTTDANAVTEPSTVIPPPSATTLVSPAQGATSQRSDTLTFVWRKSATATGYQFQLSTSSGFTTYVKNDLISDTTRKVTALSKLTKYYWRVRAYNGGGYSAYSGVDSLTTIIADPAAVTLVSPAQGATSQRSDTLNFVWTKSALAAGYHFQLSTSSGFTTYVKNDSTGDTTKKVTSLTKLTKYYWRVRAYNAAGYSSFSAVDSLTTIVADPMAVTLVSPAQGATSLRSDTLSFSWRKSATASGYNFQLSTNSGFTSHVKNDSTADTTKKVTSLTKITKYYWRVRAYNAAGYSTFSGVDSLTTIVPAPAAPLTISPSGTTNEPLMTTFKWHASMYATKYRLQIAWSSVIDSIGGFDADYLLIDVITTDTVKQLSSPLTASMVIYWHVSASDTGGTSSYSAVANFTTGTTVDVEAVDAVPVKFDLSQNYPNPFNPSTKIEYSLAKASQVSLKVYNLLGGEVATLVNGNQEAGRYTVQFSASAGNNSTLASGVYFYRLEAGSFISTKKFVLMK